MADDASQKSDISDPSKNSGAGSGQRSRMSFAEGLLAAASGHWSSDEQNSILSILRAWMRMIDEELREKQKTIMDVFSRIDLHEEKVAERIKSIEYQTLLRKAFRNWAGTESEKKQEYIRNVLTNAASTKLVSDDVVSLFIEWLQKYSEFHFAVIGELYHHPGSTRGDVWENLGKGSVREDSAEADLFRLLVRDLSTGGIIRQHRETDYRGNFIAKKPTRSVSRTGAPRAMKSAFDETESYELTALGKQFVHYAMTELTIKIAYQPMGADGASYSTAYTDVVQ